MCLAALDPLSSSPEEASDRTLLLQYKLKHLLINARICFSGVNVTRNEKKLQINN